MEPGWQNASQLSRKSAAAQLSLQCSVCTVQCAVRSVQCSVCKKCAATQLMQDMRRQFVSEVFDKFEHITGIITITIEGITKFIPFFSIIPSSNPTIPIIILATKTVESGSVGPSHFPNY